MGRTKGSRSKSKKLNKVQMTLHRYTAEHSSVLAAEASRDTIVGNTKVTACSYKRSTSDSANSEVYVLIDQPENHPENHGSAAACPNDEHITLEALIREVEGDMHSAVDEPTTIDDDPIFRVDEPTESDEDLAEAESAVLKR
ncbi:hypothetical protein BJV82DRAFT_580931 [Fennellomyces sp. T-0311]|nr:hypothetical protein BJV82DRAFT_580931 [Fennellomyces sp. T-0311]